MNPRTLLAVLHDAIAAALAWLLALWLRFNLDMPQENFVAAFQALIWMVPLYCVGFWRLGLYRGLWRYASLNDLQRMLQAIAACALAATAIIVVFGIQKIPRSVIILHPALLVLIMAGSRFAYRAWNERRLYGELRWTGNPVLVLGAGEASARLVRELMRSTEWRVVGLLDDDPRKQNMLLNGVRVLGPVASVADWKQRYNVQHAIVAMPGATATQRRHAVEMATGCGLTVLTVPALDDILSRRVSISQIRKVELEDLLGREQVVLDDAGLHALFSGKTVLVTGAGGSIGAELARQIARFAPRRLVLYELGEFALYSLEQEFAERLPDLPVACLIGDVRSEARMDEVFARYRPDVVFHAAAYKHVPLMETGNAWEAVQNNVQGTLCVAAAAQRHGAAKFVLVSTDKAVNPTNVMGATKRLAELACQHIGSGGSTAFVAVRFGNVLGSNGSVIPKFREQIARGGPVTVTHPDITRYFMSIPEAAQLVLQAALMGKGGEIFVLDMGEPVKIVDLARDMIRLSGFSEQDIRIEFTGLRPGEKLYEELLADGEQTLPTPHPKLRIVRAAAGLAPDSYAALLAWLTRRAPPGDDAVRSELSRFVPEYRPGSRG
jgi:FlaA1/EpsC-like NDP-sugar epimerase